MKLRYLLIPLPLLAGLVLLQPEGRALLQGADIPSLLPASTHHSFYKWQDARGQWHYSDQAPEGVQPLRVDVDTAANVLPAPRSLQQQEAAAPTGSSLLSQASPDLLERMGSLGDFTSPAEARQLAEAHIQRTRQLIEQH